MRKKSWYNTALWHGRSSHNVFAACRYEVSRIWWPEIRCRYQHLMRHVKTRFAVNVPTQAARTLVPCKELPKAEYVQFSFLDVRLLCITPVCPYSYRSHTTPYRSCICIGPIYVFIKSRSLRAHVISLRLHWIFLPLGLTVILKHSPFTESRFSSHVPDQVGLCHMMFGTASALTILS